MMGVAAFLLDTPLTDEKATILISTASPTLYRVHGRCLPFPDHEGLVGVEGFSEVRLLGRRESGDSGGDRVTQCGPQVWEVIIFLNGLF